MKKLNCNIYLKAALITFIGGIMLGLILGDVMPITTIQDIETDSIFEEDTETKIEKFNVVLMFQVWLISAFFSTILVGYYSTCKRLDIIINNTKTIKK